MTHDRREILTFAAMGAALSALPAAAVAADAARLHGLIGQMVAQPGKREELVGYLREATGAMPGCLSYQVALDAGNADAIWITEVWDSRESHQASLQLPAVRAAIAKARPIIAAMPMHVETVPLMGV